MNIFLSILIIIILIALIFAIKLLMPAKNKSKYKQKNNEYESQTGVRPFIPGNKAYILDYIECRSIPSKGGEKVYLNKGAKGKVVKYSREGTHDDVSDDFIGFKITSGDEAVGQTVWIPTKECKKMKKRYA